jgi:hypothetical protein
LDGPTSRCIKTTDPPTTAAAANVTTQPSQEIGVAPYP